MSSNFRVYETRTRVVDVVADSTVEALDIAKSAFEAANRGVYGSYRDKPEVFEKTATSIENDYFPWEDKDQGSRAVDAHLSSTSHSDQFGEFPPHRHSGMEGNLRPEYRSSTDQSSVDMHAITGLTQKQAEEAIAWEKKRRIENGSNK